MFDFGDIVIAQFPFTDFSGSKRRPLLVVSPDNASRLGIVACFITSVPRSGPGMAALPANTATGLKVASVARFDKVATLEKGIVTGTLGKADPAWLLENAAGFFGVFGFSTFLPDLRGQETPQ